MSIRVYRAFVNQPSTSQPLHKYHGVYGVVLEGEDETLFLPSMLDVTSMQISALWVSRTSSITFVK